MFYVRRKVGQDSYEVVDTTDWVSEVYTAEQLMQISKQVKISGVTPRGVSVRDFISIVKQRARLAGQRTFVLDNGCECLIGLDNKLYLIKIRPQGDRVVIPPFVYHLYDYLSTDEFNRDDYTQANIYSSKPRWTTPLRDVTQDLTLVWDCEHTRDFREMFYDYKGKQLTLDFKTSPDVTLSFLFKGCDNLEKVTFGHRWRTSAVKEYNSMFFGTSKLKSIDFGSISLPLVREYTLFTDSSYAYDEPMPFLKNIIVPDEQMQFVVLFALDAYNIKDCKVRVVGDEN